MDPRTVVLVIKICLAIAVLQTPSNVCHAQTGDSVLTVTSGLPNQGWARLLVHHLAHQQNNSRCNREDY